MIDGIATLEQVVEMARSSARPASGQKMSKAVSRNKADDDLRRRWRNTKRKAGVR